MRLPLLNYIVPALALSIVGLTTPVISQTGMLALQSPDKKTEVRVATTNHLAVSILHNNNLLALISPIELEINGRLNFGNLPRRVSSHVSSVNEVLLPVVAEKRSKIPDIYNQLTVRFEGGWSLIVRAYDDGVAYRFRTELPGEIEVTNEKLSIQFAPGDSIWFPEETSFLSHSERQFAAPHQAIRRRQNHPWVQSRHQRRQGGQRSRQGQDQSPPEERRGRATCLLLLLSRVR